MGFRTFNAGDLLGSGDLNRSFFHQNYIANRCFTQWGNLVAATDGSGDLTINFPSTFPVDCRIVLFTCGDKNVNFCQFEGHNPPAANQVIVRCLKGDGTAVLSTTVRIHWIAIGR